MSIIRSILIGTGIGLLLGVTKDFIDSRSAYVEDEFVNTDLEEETQMKEETTDLTKALAKEAKDRTLTETLAVYESEDNQEMVEKIKETITYLEEKELYKAPLKTEQTVDLSIDHLCKKVAETNKELIILSHKELDELRSKLWNKSTRKLTYLVPLPEELCDESRESNTAFTRTIKLNHIKDANKRIENINKIYTKTSLKILEKDYFQLLYNIVNMHKNLSMMRVIMPSIGNMNPSINVISDTVYSPKNKVDYLNYLKSKMTEKEFEFCKRYRKELEFNV